MTPVPKQRRHHYVPRLILRRFAVQRKRGKFQTQVFDKSTGRTFTSSVEDVMVEGDFNALEAQNEHLSLEAHVSDYESLAAPVITRILDAGSLRSLTSVDRLELARFVALQFVRGTAHRAMFSDASHQLSTELANRGLDIGLDFRATPHETKAFGLLSILDSLPEYSSHMAVKQMLLLQAPTGAEFILGDNPVALHNDEPKSFYGNLGLACKGIQIYLPLSSKYCLALWCPSHRERIEQALKSLRSQIGT